MKKNKNILIMCLMIFVFCIFSPMIILYLLEDKNFNYLNSVSLDMMKEVNNKFDNEVIKVIYARYNETKYNVTTSDIYQYPIVDKVIDDQHIINDDLVMLKELESVGLLKNDFFVHLSTNERIITRTNKFSGDNLNYSSKRIFLSNDNFDVSFMSYEVEDITGKIIGLKIPKEYIVIERETLEKYITYLELDSEDWIFENNSIISKLNKIEIKIENINSFISISIVPYLI